MARSWRSKICKEVDYALPNKGFFASQNLYFYGYKLHAICSIEGVFQSFDLSPASVHDIHYLQDVKSQLSDCVLFVDKGYLSQMIHINLFNEANIQLESPKEPIKKITSRSFTYSKNTEKKLKPCSLNYVTSL